MGIDGIVRSGRLRAAVFFSPWIPSTLSIA